MVCNVHLILIFIISNDVSLHLKFLTGKLDVGFQLKWSSR
jgi:uncharacterized integral membrane protein